MPRYDIRDEDMVVLDELAAPNDEEAIFVAEQMIDTRPDHFRNRGELVLMCNLRVVCELEVAATQEVTPLQ